MQEKVVLPDFKIPGSEIHWTTKGLYIAGGLLGIQAVALGAWLLFQGDDSNKKAKSAQNETVAVAGVEKDVSTTDLTALPGGVKAAESVEPRKKAETAEKNAGAEGAIAKKVKKAVSKRSNKRRDAKRRQLRRAKRAKLARQSKRAKKSRRSEASRRSDIDELLAGLQ